MKMKHISLEEVARICSGEYRGPESFKKSAISGVVTDSRAVTEGSLFVAISGNRSDGHDFIKSACENGAVCALAEKEPANGAPCPYVLVESTLQALKDLSEYYRSLFDIPIIGITGSVGKTTSKEMIAAVLSQKYNVLKTEGNLNNEIGVPLTLLRLEDGHEAAVVELGISEFGEMRRLSKMVRPDIVVITNIGYSHLEFLGDRGGVLRAKGEIFEYMNPSGHAVLCGDDDLLCSLDISELCKNGSGISKVLFGLGERNGFRAENIRNLGATGTACDMIFDGGRLPVIIPGFGSHMVLPALAAAAVGRLLDILGDEIKVGLLNYSAVGGRANILDTGFITIIDDCYNSNPDSMKAALLSLSSVEGRKVCIMGDMKELGAEGPSLHRMIGEYATGLGIDRIIACGDLAEEIYKGAEHSERALYFPNKESLISCLPALISKKDSVLVKASRSMKFEEIISALKTLS